MVFDTSCGGRIALHPSNVPTARPADVSKKSLRLIVFVQMFINCGCLMRRLTDRVAISAFEN
jgi:hypothetical protein